MRTTPKKLGGFMCQSPAATAVCISTDPRSVIVSRKPTTRLVNNFVKYSKLVESPSLNSSKKESDLVMRKKNIMAIQKPAPSPHFVFQVVVMRVALHCQGCASKVRRHLSKMEGVTSFSIDLEAKKVTVMGHITPITVLESISKVKRAELWIC